MAWLTGWSYRKKITLGQATGATTGYQKELVIHSGAGTDGSPNANDIYLNSKCTSFPSDITFTQDDGDTEEKYYDEVVDATTSRMWVKVTGDIDADDVDIYIYYGKSGQASQSDPANVWDNWYNPEDDTTGQDPSGWTLSQPANTDIVISETEAKFGSKSVKYYDNSSVAGPDGRLTISKTSLRVLRWMWVSLTNQQVGFEVWDGNVSNAIYLWFLTDANIKYYDTAWRTLVGYSAEQWYRLEAVCVASSGVFDIKIDDTWYSDKNLRGTPTTFDIVRFITGSANKVTMYHDVVAVGRYVDPEPVVSAIAAEELALKPSSASIVPIMQGIGMLAVPSKHRIPKLPSFNSRFPSLRLLRV